MYKRDKKIICCSGERALHDEDSQRTVSETLLMDVLQQVI